MYVARGGLWEGRGRGGAHARRQGWVGDGGRGGFMCLLQRYAAVRVGKACLLYLPYLLHTRHYRNGIHLT